EKVSGLSGPFFLKARSTAAEATAGNAYPTLTENVRVADAWPLLTVTSTTSVPAKVAGGSTVRTLPATVYVTAGSALVAFHGKLGSANAAAGGGARRPALATVSVKEPSQWRRSPLGRMKYHCWFLSCTHFSPRPHVFVK